MHLLERHYTSKVELFAWKSTNWTLVLILSISYNIFFRKFKIFTLSKIYFIEITLVKYISFNFLHNDNYMITSSDKARHKNDN